MKAKQIKDLGTAIANDSNVQQNTTDRHTHDETQNVIPKSDGAGNYDDAQIIDDGTSIAIGDLTALDSNTLITVKKAIQKLIKLDQVHTGSDSTLLDVDATFDNTAKNYGGIFSADGSTDENIAIAVDLGKMIIGALTGDDSSLVQLESTTQGFTPPRMTTAQMNAIVSPMKGLIIYDTDTNDLMLNIGDGTTPNWVGLKAVGITGSGTINQIPRFVGGTTLDDGSITDDGSTLSVGTTLDSNILLKMVSSLFNGIKMIMDNTVGSVYSIIGRAEGSSSHNVGVIGNTENALENDGVIGISGTSIFKPWRDHVGVRGIAYNTDPNKTAHGVVGYTLGTGSGENVAVYGYARYGNRNRAIVGQGGGFICEPDQYLSNENDESAVFQLVSNSRGFLAPKMTTAEKNAIVNPANGLIIFDTDVNDVQINIGSTSSPNWVGTGAGSVQGTFTDLSVPRADGNGTMLVDGSINDDGSTIAIGSAPSGSIKNSTVVISSESLTSAIKGFNGSTQSIETIGVEGVSNGSKLLANIGVQGYANNSSFQNTGVEGVAINGNNSVVLIKHMGGNFVADNNGLNESVVGAVFQAVGDNTADNVGFLVYVRNNGSGDAIIGRINNDVDNTGKHLKVINIAGDVALEDITPESIVGDFPDGSFKIQGSSDSTKKIRFEVDGLTTATTRTITTPDRDITLVGNGVWTANKLVRYDSNGDLQKSIVLDDGSTVSVAGDFDANVVEATEQFKSPTSFGNTTTSNNYSFDCNVGMVQELDLQGQTGNGSLTITNPIEGNTYSMIVIQGSGTHNLTFPSGWWINDTPPFDFTTLADNDRVMVTMSYINATWYFATKQLTFHNPAV